MGELRDARHNTATFDEIGPRIATKLDKWRRQTMTGTATVLVSEIERVSLHHDSLSSVACANGGHDQHPRTVRDPRPTAYAAGDGDREQEQCEARAHSAVTQHVFVPGIGQDDNLGDSALRRAMLDILRSPGRVLHVAVPGSSESYTGGLGLQESDVRYGSWKEWLAALRRTSQRSIVLNAGEQAPRQWWWYPGPYVIPAIVLARRSGGAVIQTGVGFKGPLPASKTHPSIPALRKIDTIWWRDQPTRDFAGRGSVAPDWAFALGRPVADWPPTESRGLLAVTLRFDREPPTHGWFDRVRALATTNGLAVVTFAQVERDRERAQWLARELGGQYVAVSSFAHVTLDRETRALYQQCSAVLSDRVHALIIAATEGAVPIGSAPDEPEKLARTLAPAGLGANTFKHDRFNANLVDLAAEHDLLPERIEAARSALAKLAVVVGARLDEAR